MCRYALLTCLNMNECLVFCELFIKGEFCENRRTLPKWGFMISKLVVGVYSCLYDRMMMDL